MPDRNDINTGYGSYGGGSDRQADLESLVGTLTDSNSLDSREAPQGVSLADIIEANREWMRSPAAAEARYDNGELPGLAVNFRMNRRQEKELGTFTPSDKKVYTESTLALTDQVLKGIEERGWEIDHFAPSGGGEELAAVIRANGKQMRLVVASPQMDRIGTAYLNRKGIYRASSYRTLSFSQRRLAERYRQMDSFPENQKGQDRALYNAVKAMGDTDYDLMRYGADVLGATPEESNENYKQAFREGLIEELGYRPDPDIANGLWYIMHQSKEDRLKWKKGAVHSYPNRGRVISYNVPLDGERLEEIQTNLSRRLHGRMPRRWEEINLYRAPENPEIVNNILEPYEVLLGTAEDPSQYTMSKTQKGRSYRLSREGVGNQRARTVSYVALNSNYNSSVEAREKEALARPENVYELVKGAYEAAELAGEEEVPRIEDVPVLGNGELDITHVDMVLVKQYQDLGDIIKIFRDAQGQYLNENPDKGVGDFREYLAQDARNMSEQTPEEGDLTRAQTENYDVLDEEELEGATEVYSETDGARQSIVRMMVGAVNEDRLYQRLDENGEPVETFLKESQAGVLDESEYTQGHHRVLVTTGAALDQVIRGSDYGGTQELYFDNDGVLHYGYQLYTGRDENDQPTGVEAPRTYTLGQFFFPAEENAFDPDNDKVFVQRTGVINARFANGEERMLIPGSRGYLVSPEESREINAGIGGENKMSPSYNSFRDLGNENPFGRAQEIVYHEMDGVDEDGDPVLREVREFRDRGISDSDRDSLLSRVRLKSFDSMMQDRVSAAVHTALWTESPLYDDDGYLRGDVLYEQMRASTSLSPIYSDYTLPTNMEQINRPGVVEQGLATIRFDKELLDDLEDLKVHETRQGSYDQDVNGDLVENQHIRQVLKGLEGIIDPVASSDGAALGLNAVMTDGFFKYMYGDVNYDEPAIGEETAEEREARLERIQRRQVGEYRFNEGFRRDGRLVPSAREFEPLVHPQTGEFLYDAKERQDPDAPGRALERAKVFGKADRPVVDDFLSLSDFDRDELLNRIHSGLSDEAGRRFAGIVLAHDSLEGSHESFGNDEAEESVRGMARRDENGDVVPGTRNLSPKLEGRLRAMAEVTENPVLVDYIDYYKDEWELIDNGQSRYTPDTLNLAFSELVGDRIRESRDLILLREMRTPLSEASRELGSGLDSPDRSMQYQKVAQVADKVIGGPLASLDETGTPIEKPNVALMTSGGLTFEDAIPISRDFADKHNLHIGDKFSDAHANKGVVTYIGGRQETLIDKNGQEVPNPRYNKEYEDFLKNNPHIDLIQSPYGPVSRANMGLIHELTNSEDIKELKDNDGNVMGYSGQMSVIVTNMTAHNKTVLYGIQDLGRSRHLSYQQLFALETHEADALIQEMFDHTDSHHEELNEYMNILGMQLDDDGVVATGRIGMDFQEVTETLPGGQGQRTRYIEEPRVNEVGDVEMLVLSTEDVDGVLPATAAYMELPVHYEYGSQEHPVESRYVPIPSAKLRRQSMMQDDTVEQHIYDRTIQDIANVGVRLEEQKLKALEHNFGRYKNQFEVESLDALAEKVESRDKAFFDALAREDFGNNQIKAQEEELRNRVDGYMTKVERDKFGYDEAPNSVKHSFIRRSIVATDIPDSASAIMTNDPTLAIDEMGMSPALAANLGLVEFEDLTMAKIHFGLDREASEEELKEVMGQAPMEEIVTAYKDNWQHVREYEDDRVVFWRDPILHDGSVAAFKVAIDDELVGASAHPLITQEFGLDFDGDQGAFAHPKTRAAQRDLEEKLNIRRNMFNGRGELALNISMDAAHNFGYSDFGKNYRQELAERGVDEESMNADDLTHYYVQEEIVKPSLEDQHKEWEASVGNTLADRADRMLSEEAQDPESFEGRLLESYAHEIDVRMNEDEAFSQRMREVFQERDLNLAPEDHEIVQSLEDLSPEDRELHKASLDLVRERLGQSQVATFEKLVKEERVFPGTLDQYSTLAETCDKHLKESLANHSERIADQMDDFGRQFYLNEAGAPSRTIDIRSSEQAFESIRDIAEAGEKGHPDALDRNKSYLMDGVSYKDCSLIREALAAKVDLTGQAGAQMLRLAPLMTDVNFRSIQEDVSGVKIAMDVTEQPTQAVLSIKHDPDKVPAVERYLKNARMFTVGPYGGMEGRPGDPEAKAISPEAMVKQGVLDRANQGDKYNPYGGEYTHRDRALVEFKANPQSDAPVFNPIPEDNGIYDETTTKEYNKLVDSLNDLAEDIQGLYTEEELSQSETIPSIHLDINTGEVFVGSDLKIEESGLPGEGEDSQRRFQVRRLTQEELDLEKARAQGRPYAQPVPGNADLSKPVYAYTPNEVNQGNVLTVNPDTMYRVAFKATYDAVGLSIGLGDIDAVQASVREDYGRLDPGVGRQRVYDVEKENSQRVPVVAKDGLPPQGAVKDSERYRIQSRGMIPHEVNMERSAAVIDQWATGGSKAIRQTAEFNDRMIREGRQDQVKALGARKKEQNIMPEGLYSGVNERVYKRYLEAKDAYFEQVEAVREREEAHAAKGFEVSSDLRDKARGLGFESESSEVQPDEVIRQTLRDNDQVEAGGVLTLDQTGEYINEQVKVNRDAEQGLGFYKPAEEKAAEVSTDPTMGETFREKQAETHKREAITTNTNANREYNGATYGGPDRAVTGRDSLGHDIGRQGQAVQKKAWANDPRNRQAQQQQQQEQITSVRSVQDAQRLDQERAQAIIRESRNQRLQRARERFAQRDQGREDLAMEV